MEIIFQNHKSKTAKITDFFFTLGTPSMGQYYNTFSVFQNYGAKHNFERKQLCVQNQPTINYHIDISG